MEKALKIQPATPDHIPIISELAEHIWPTTYTSILSQEQIRLMLDKMYAPHILAEQMASDTQFYLGLIEQTPIGFMAVRKCRSILRIEKLYLNPDQQHSGFGTQLIQYALTLARNIQCLQIELNVNRLNPALNFYKKMGFKIIQQVDIPFYTFYMNDFVMRLQVDVNKGV